MSEAIEYCPWVHPAVLMTCAAEGCSKGAGIHYGVNGECSGEWWCPEDDPHKKED